MKMNSLFNNEELPKLKGHLRMEIYRGDIHTPEHLLQIIEKDNLVVTLGKQILLDRLFGLNGPPAAIGNVGVGTENTAAASTDTKLNPSGGGTVLFQTADAGTARAGQVVTITSTFGTGVANFTWAECGLANSNTNDGTHLFDRIAPIGPFTKTSSVSIILTITITQN